MPWYRINGMPVHIKGTKLPKPCAARIGIAPNIVTCADISGYLCDGELDAGCSCDRPVCSAHAREIGLNRHLCPDCSEIASKNESGDLFTGLLSKVNS